MAKQALLDIGMNDTLTDVIRKVNTNFRIMKQDFDNDSVASDLNIEEITDQFVNALNGVVEDFSQAIYNERTARQDKDAEIENNYCPLDSNGLVDPSNLPSYVDDVVEVYPRQSATELSANWFSLTSNGPAITPEAGKVYIMLSNSSSYAANSQFRWSGNTYVNITSSGADGITPSVTVTSISGGHNVAFEYGSGDARNVDFNVLDGIDGTNGTNGVDGADGADGADGIDGVTPRIITTTITGGHNVAFSYGTGDPRNTNFDVMDGLGNVTGVKGDAESIYRSGNVNLTSADIGSAPASHTHTGADITDLFDAIYPVGSIYMSVNSTSPDTLFGGTWERITGSFLLAATDNGNSGASQAAGNTGGAATVTLTAAQSGVPAHAHGLNGHKHSVGAHAHGLNSHVHGLNSHTHTLSSHTHGLNSHTHTLSSHTHRMKGNGNHWMKMGLVAHSGSGHAMIAGFYCDTEAEAQYTGGPSTNTSGGASGNTAGPSTNTSGGASGNTATASGNTANSTAFDSGAASGNTANNTAADASSAHENMPPYLSVYIWKRTA